MNLRVFLFIKDDFKTINEFKLLINSYKRE